MSSFEYNHYLQIENWDNHIKLIMSIGYQCSFDYSFEVKWIFKAARLTHFRCWGLIKISHGWTWTWEWSWCRWWSRSHRHEWCCSRITRHGWTTLLAVFLFQWQWVCCGLKANFIVNDDCATNTIFQKTFFPTLLVLLKNTS